jgi:uncharacterized membrane protein YciS (DUF1049 family)
VIVLGIILVLWIGVTNADQRVNFRLFTHEYPDLPLNLLLLVVFAAGMVFSFLIAVFNEFQLRTTLNRQKRLCKQLEEELAALRNLPLEGGEPQKQEDR